MHAQQSRAVRHIFFVTLRQTAEIPQIIHGYSQGSCKESCHSVLPLAPSDHGERFRGNIAEIEVGTSMGMNIDESRSRDQPVSRDHVVKSSGNAALADFFDLIVTDDQISLRNIDSGGNDPAVLDQGSHSTSSRLILSAV